MKTVEAEESFLVGEGMECTISRRLSQSDGIRGKGMEPGENIDPGELQSREYD